VAASGAASAGPDLRHGGEPGGARFIAPDAGEYARIRAKHTFLKPLTVPAGSYPTRTRRSTRWDHGVLFLARENLPDDVAYRLARSLHGAESTLCKKLAQACETTAANTIAARHLAPS